MLYLIIIYFRDRKNIYDVLWYLNCTVFGHGSLAICKLMLLHWLPNTYQRKTLSIGMGNNIWPVGEPVPKIIIILLCSLPISFIRVSKKWRNGKSSCRQRVITIKRKKIWFSLFPAVVFPHLLWMQQINLSYLMTKNLHPNKCHLLASLFTFEVSWNLFCIYI